MDTSWANAPRNSEIYRIGLDGFMNTRFGDVGDTKIICPCKKCRNILLATKEDAKIHLLCDGFMKGYFYWISREEGSSSNPPTINPPSNSNFSIDDNTHLMLNEAFGVTDDNMSEDGNMNIDRDDQPNMEAMSFYKLLKDAQQEVYPGCTKFSVLSFVVRLLHIKSKNKWSDKSMTELLQFLKEAFPKGEKLPGSYYEAKKVVGDLGLSYKKIHACPNDCILYWKEHAQDKECYVCKSPRYKRGENNVENETESSANTTKIPEKVLWHFPLIPRLQRLFMSSKTASFMRWHKEDRIKDEYMRHPADSPAWQTFDYHNGNFAKDPRNVRLGLACDGFNPFKTLSVSHSTWPVVLIPYNMPPWMCMKQQYFMLLLLIPGPSAPGNDIDVYLQPLIDELKELWDLGVNTYDVSTKQNFFMHAALLWTINDFPAYANLSGWSTRGELACPSCNKHTCSRWLKYSGKHCYMGHRRFLDMHDPFRRDKRSFDGSEEYEGPPHQLTGSMVLDDLDGYDHTFGKLVNHNPMLPFNWKKRSIFFELPYWKDNLLRHNLDVMHIEKNLCDNIVGTLLNLEGKSKDHLKARRDLQDMGIRQELHPIEFPSGRIYLPPSCFSMDKREKEIFLSVLKNVKVPDGYASNISRCVQLKPHKLIGLKSHDSHILMQQLLPIALRRVLPNQVRLTLIELCNFFKELCSKVLHPSDLTRLEGQIAQTLCQLEKQFPPTLFDILVHLPIHLACEALMGGPVQYRWMYPIERYLSTLKSYVRNRSRPEGSIAEGYLVEECMTFCSRYLEDIETKLNRPSRNYDEGGDDTIELSIFKFSGCPFGKETVVTLDKEILSKAYHYILFNCDAVDPFISEHQSIIQAKHPHLRRRDAERIHVAKFASWFKKKVRDAQFVEERCISEELKVLGRGPNMVGKRYKGFIINGFRFHTKNIEKKRKTQNSGVIITAKTMSFSSANDRNPRVGDVVYYVIIKDIIELNYSVDLRVVLFECEWVAPGRIKHDEHGFTLVNHSRSNSHEPFVLASQVQQAFYVEDPIDKGWHVVVKIMARDSFDMGTYLSAYVEANSRSDSCNNQDQQRDAEMSWVRMDMEGTVVED